MKKKILRFSLIFNGMINLLLIIAFLSGSKILMITAMVSVGLMILSNAIASTVLDGLHPNWFKEEEELKRLQEEVKKEWSEVHNLNMIVGQHEAIKAWNKRENKKIKI